jgi:WD40 repeat protein
MVRNYAVTDLGFSCAQIPWETSMSHIFISHSSRDTEQAARVWEAETGRLLATLAGHTARVNAAAFLPDGTLIVTASQDSTARLWDAESGLLLGTLTGHTDQVNRAAFSLDGKLIATASSDKTARLYIGDLPDLLNWARRQLPAEGGSH